MMSARNRRTRLDSVGASRVDGTGGIVIKGPPFFGFFASRRPTDSGHRVQNSQETLPDDTLVGHVHESSDNFLMLNKELPFPLGDAEDQAFVFAMYENPSSLAAKLKAIHEAAVNLVLCAEQKHKAIKKVWGSQVTVFTKQSLDRRIALSKTLEHPSSLAVVSDYLGTLRRLGEITEAFKTINALRPSRKEFTTLEEEMHSFWNGRGSVPVQELDKLVPLFFSLQLHCRSLYFALKSPRSALTNKMLQDRARAGGVASNAGEVVLRERVLCHLMLRPSDEEWKSLSKLFEENRQQLATILERYQTSPPVLEDGRLASACMALTEDNMYRKLGEWAEQSPEFLKELQRLVPSYRRQIAVAGDSQ
jgi:hypothetical protein